MGNVLLREGICCRRRIKIMKADGTVMKLRSAVSVKEILIDYPNHGIFEAPSGPPLAMGRFTRPLPERAKLVAAHLYYLIPLPLPQHKVINYNNNRKGGHFARLFSDHNIPRASGSSGSRLQPESCGDIGRDSINQEPVDDVVNKINRGGVRIISSSYSTDGSTLRVKLRLRKENLPQFLAALIQGATQESSWKPRLDTIVERHSPYGYL